MKKIVCFIICLMLIHTGISAEQDVAAILASERPGAPGRPRITTETVNAETAAGTVAEQAAQTPTPSPAPPEAPTSPILSVSAPEPVTELEVRGAGTQLSQEGAGQSVRAAFAQYNQAKNRGDLAATSRSRLILIQELSSFGSTLTPESAVQSQSNTRNIALLQIEESEFNIARDEQRLRELQERRRSETGVAPPRLNSEIAGLEQSITAERRRAERFRQELTELEEQLRTTMQLAAPPPEIPNRLSGTRNGVNLARAELSRQRAAGITGRELDAALLDARDAERAFSNALQQQAEQETDSEERFNLQLQAQAAHKNAAVLEIERTGNTLAFLQASPDIESDYPDLVAVTEQYENARQEAAQAEQQIEILRFEREKWYINIVQVMTGLLKGYREYAGLATLGSLFIDDEELDKRRNQIDQQFCDSILFGGVKCWTSKICDGYIDTTPGGSALIAAGPAQTPFGFAHIEAEKSLPIYTVEGGKKVTLYQYKVTYALTNPLDKAMFYNVEFASQDKTAKAFGEDITVGEGLSDGRLGGQSLIPPLSATDYTSVCLTWTPAITSFDGKRENKFCVPISQYEGAATKPYEQAITVSVAGKQVTIQGFRYSPNIITIDEGESVTWTNQDDTAHTVTITQGQETFDSAEIAPGQQFSYTFTKPGTYSYECTIHTAMKGSIHVKPAAAAQPTPTAEKKEDFKFF